LNGEKITPVDIREEDNYTKKISSGMEMVKDATSRGIKKAHEFENSNSKKE